MFNFYRWIHKYPFETLHEMNIDWVIEAVKELAKELENYEIVNQITYRGHWDITKQYPTWSIVIDEATNTGYISLKPVPAGVDINNGEYWEMVAEFTGLIGDLADRVEALEDDMPIVKAEADEAIDIINANNLIDANIAVWIGDSYTIAGSLGPDYQTERFSYLVSQHLGLVEKNYAVGGCGYTHGASTYAVQVANAIVDFTTNHIDFNKVKYVFLMGNRNDTDDNLGYNDYANPVRDTITAAHAAFPRAKIIIIPGLWDWKCAPQYLLRLTQIINQVAQRFPYCQIVNNAWQWLTGYASDILWQNGADVHPDYIGHQIIANHIICALDGRDYLPVFQYEFVPTTRHANVSDCKMYIQVANGQVNFRCRFKVSENPTSGELFRFTFNSLNLPGIFIMNNSDSIYTYAFSNGGTQTDRPSVHIAQQVTKTDTTDGSMYLNAYCYDAGTKWAVGDGEWNEIQFSIPYGVRFALY